MALKSVASRRYAQALLESINHDKATTLEKALEELSGFAKIFDSTFELRNSLLNPAFTRPERTKVLGALLDKLAYSKTVRRFIELIAERDRMPEIGDIADAFRQLADEHRGRIRAEVQSAAPLSAESTDRLKKVLERTTGKSIDLELTVNPALIGGIKARVGSLVFDGTISSELERLRSSLVAAE
ncbi:ATP synthase F1 subunit delta [Myxococcota bacterium]|nr:ATP synthase F1 subunit delta [Myxococcota bacterium]